MNIDEIEEKTEVLVSMVDKLGELLPDLNKIKYFDEVKDIESMIDYFTIELEAMETYRQEIWEEERNEQIKEFNDSRL